MLTEKDYCDYDTSRSLKELGFICGIGEYACCIYDEAWHDQVDRPLLYEAQKFLREDKKVHIEVYACAGGYMWELCKAYETNTFSGAQQSMFTMM